MKSRANCWSYKWLPVTAMYYRSNLVYCTILFEEWMNLTINNKDNLNQQEADYAIARDAFASKI